MARIRSIHPGMYTDELYMGLSLAAKIVWPGIWTEADDHGVFEWKPITFKARLLPNDAVDMPALMNELVERDLVRRFEIEGKQYGVCRGFGKWQRPKKPLYRFPLPDEFHTYARYSPKGSEPLPHQDDTPTPEGEQREEEGGRMEEEPITDSGTTEETAPVGATPLKPDSRGSRLDASWQPTAEQLAYAAEQGCPDPKQTAEDFRGHFVQKPGKEGRSLDWSLRFQRWCREEKNFRRAPPSGSSTRARAVSTPTIDNDSDAQWRARLRRYHVGGVWSPGWGPRPESGECYAPKQILEEWLEAQPKSEAA